MAQDSLPADRGKQVHEICAAIAKGLYVTDIPDDCAGYVVSFRNWFNNYVAEAIFVEHLFSHHLYKYIGTPDLIVRLKRHKYLTLIDNKTPISLSKAWRLQMATYYGLYKGDIDIKKYGSLRLHPEGGPAKFEDYTGNFQQDFAIFPFRPECVAVLHGG